MEEGTCRSGGAGWSRRGDREEEWEQKWRGYRMGVKREQEAEGIRRNEGGKVEEWREWGGRNGVEGTGWRKKWNPAMWVERKSLMEDMEGGVREGTK
ncbi:hypothetical protein Pmani_009440 [Petrolisthes manimaculis]|uniref:Uncharacterized protein n=1 Tax=Petrolisthes manimaculis TaxID=1843537 RepID=A0AAE1Q493_9EUCA|nr:hypothetical protein Pmani_009440 [Petrolisthes manimaculis]